jgi:hypothetical protein
MLKVSHPGWPDDAQRKYFAQENFAQSDRSVCNNIKETVVPDLELVGVLHEDLAECLHEPGAAVQISA